MDVKPSPAIVEMALAIDEIEKARTKLLRAARTSVEMLNDAVHALQHGSPLVTEEYMERVIVMLKEAES